VIARVKKVYYRARFKYLPKLVQPLLGVTPRKDLVYIGTQYGGWSVPDSLMTPQSIVYCVGCGEDISFDLGVIERYGCHVWAFDPTPRAIAHVQKHGTHPNYHFRPVGLWSEDTRMTFYLNDNPASVSGSLVGLTGTQRSIEVDCRSLRTLMAENGHDHIDVLKLDVEGAEYTIIESILRQDILPTCLCVDFDQPTPFRKTRALIRELAKRGYQLAEIRVWDYVFVKAS
jgi:FkbM family methyltransferase